MSSLEGRTAQSDMNLRLKCNKTTIQDSIITSRFRWFSFSVNRPKPAYVQKSKNVIFKIVNDSNDRQYDIWSFHPEILHSLNLIELFIWKANKCTYNILYITVFFDSSHTIVL
jgi:adenine specific DNA methylase Mod